MSAMNLYVLKRKDWDYDEVFELVVLAESLHEARRLAAGSTRDRRWLDARRLTYSRIKQDRSRVVLKAVRFG